MKLVPYAAFLPPAVVVSDDGDEEELLRAIVIVRESTAKVGQEYIGPLLVLSGAEYAAISFQALHDRLCDALRGSRPRIVAEVHGEDGSQRLIFDDGTTRDPDAER